MSRKQRTWFQRTLQAVYIISIIIFILMPIVIVVVMSFNEGKYFSFPPTSLSFRWYNQAIVRPEWRRAFFVSLRIASLTALFSTLVGLSAGLALHRGKFRGRDALASFFMSPLILPQLLLGLAMLFFLARFKLIGSPLPLFLGHILITFPYVLRITGDL